MTLRLFFRSFGPPFLRLFRLVPRVVQAHEALRRLGQPCGGAGWNVCGALLHALVAYEQQCLCCRETFLTCEASAEQRFGVERPPIVGLARVAERQALSKQRLGLDMLPLTHKIASELGECPRDV